jgi:hypothetical protein
VSRPWDDTGLGRWQRHQFEMDRIGGHYRPGPSDAEDDYLEENRGWLIGWTPSPSPDRKDEQA